MTWLYFLREQGRRLVMRELSTWSFSLGAWAGVRVRLHVFFVIFAIVAAMEATRQGVVSYWAACLGILFASTLAHEIGHLWVARRVGARMSEIVLWPLGGLSSASAPNEPHAEWLTALAGPLVNLMICLAIAPVAIAVDRSLLHLSLSSAPWIDPIGWKTVLALTFWINWLLAIVNVLPAMPLDGGRALRALVAAKTDIRHAIGLGSRAAVLSAVGLLLAAWCAYDAEHPLAWVSLTLLALVCYFSSKLETERVEEREPETPAFEFPTGYANGDSSVSTQERVHRPSFLTRWRQRREETRRVKQLQQKMADERRLDEILVRLHASGMDALSDDDRAVLHRASERYRSKPR